MPVPISVTNPKGVGLAAANPVELPTSGPFARAASDANQPGAAANGQLGAARNACSNNTASAAPGDPEAGMGVETRQLNFWYPDIGGLSL